MYCLNAFDVSGFSSVCLSSGVWPSYCGRLIRFSAFRHCSIYIDKDCVRDVFSESLG